MAEAYICQSVVSSCSDMRSISSDITALHTIVEVEPVGRTPEYECRGMIAVRQNFAILDPFGLILSGEEHQFGWQRVHRHPVGFGGFE